MQLDKERKENFLAGGESTLNNTGYMTGSLDPYSKEFTVYAGQVSGKVIDIGACYGVATIPALESGGRVIATDNDSRHLEILRSRTPLAHRDRLECVVGSLPNDLKFAHSSISAILCCRVLHLLKEDEIDESLNCMYDWLEPGGRIYLINDTPYTKISDKMLRDFFPIYEERKKLGVKWPGYISNLQEYLQPEFCPICPSFVTLTDVDTLVRACQRCNFDIIKASYLARPDYPPTLQNDGRENAGVIARKK